MSIEQKLCNLLTWIKTFDVAGDINSIAEITDGLVIGQVLNFISPAFFSDQWLTGISSEANENWELKCLNLKYIVQAMIEFLSQATEPQLLVQLTPDEMAIVNRSDDEAIFRLLQLVLGCAVNSESKQTHIHNILCMQESVQHVLKEAIQQLMPSGTGTYNNLPAPVDEYGSGCYTTTRDALAQRCHDLEYQMSQLRNEKAVLESENQQLRTARSSSESSTMATAPRPTGVVGLGIDQDASQPDDVTVRVACADNVLSPTIASVRISQLQDQLTKLRTELYRVEAVKEENSIRLTDALSQNDDLRQKVEQLAKRAEEATHLKDELDIVREELSKVVHTSSNLDKLRRRADEAGELRVRCAKLETDNAVCLERLAELEQEARLSSNLRSQIEKHRLEAADLRQEAVRARGRVENTEAELKLVKEELTAVVGEKTRLVYELNRHQNCCEDSQLYHLSSDSTTVVDEDGSEYKNLREDLHHLTASMSSLEVASQSEQAQRGDAVTWTESSTVIPAAAPPADMASEVKSSGGDHETETQGLVDDRLAALQAQLAVKDEQMAQMEQRYRGYLWKAKEVIRLLDKRRRSLEEQRQQASDTVIVSDEVDRLRGLLVQKEAVIERLEQYHEQTRRQRDLEERVVVSAWYNLAGHVLRESAMSETPEEMAAGDSESADQFQTLNCQGTLAGKASLLDRQREVHLKPPRGLTSIVMKDSK